MIVEEVLSRNKKCKIMYELSIPMNVRTFVISVERVSFAQIKCLFTKEGCILENGRMHVSIVNGEVWILVISYTTGKNILRLYFLHNEKLTPKCAA
jgi:hypothetical protein